MSTDEDTRAATVFAGLIHDKAWEHLGLTGEEFTRAWYAGRFEGDDRPAVRSLDHLMRTGHWAAPE